MTTIRTNVLSSRNQEEIHSESLWLNLPKVGTANPKSKKDPGSFICFRFTFPVFLAGLFVVMAGVGGPLSTGFSQQKKSSTDPTGSTVSNDLKRALSFEPIQRDVVYDIPTAEEMQNCKIESAEKIGQRGFLVYDGNGRLLRAYLDTNNDRKPDQWSYYRDGIEVYRDIDSDFDEKADQYRWMGTAGTRWGDDKNQDGIIDRWKVISPEEVTMEVVAAIRDKDPKRFNLLLLSEVEIKSLGLGSDFEAEVLKRTQQARVDFVKFVQSQTLVDSQSSWMHFGGIKPGVIPANTHGSTKDVMIYDSVQAVVNTGSKHGQLAIGTLIKLGDAWKVIDLPEVIQDGVAISNGGAFFNASMTTVGPLNTEVNNAFDSASQTLFSKYAELEEKMGTATGRDLASLHQQRAETLLKLSEAASNAQDRSNWIRQMADDVSGAFQNDEFPQGFEFLKQTAIQLEQQQADIQDIAHIQYRGMAAFFTKKLTSASNDDFQDVEKEFNNALEAFIKKYPKASHVPDAMLQLALSAEFKENIDQASNWYEKIATEFSSSPLARKAAGAKRRLTSEGKEIAFSGKTTRGDAWSLSRERGRVVLIHFWATWCEPCKEDMKTIKRLASKYQNNNFTVIGVSVDDSPTELQQYLRTEQIPWTQLHEEGGMDGPLAEQLGIATLPTMLLIDKNGKVIHRNLMSSELDRAIQRATRDE